MVALDLSAPPAKSPRSTVASLRPSLPRPAKCACRGEESNLSGRKPPTLMGAAGRPTTAAANLGRDLPPNGEGRFPFIPFRYGSSLRTGRFGSHWGGRCPPQWRCCSATAHRLPPRIGQAVVELRRTLRHTDANLDLQASLRYRRHWLVLPVKRCPVSSPRLQPPFVPARLGLG